MRAPIRRLLRRAFAALFFFIVVFFVFPALFDPSQRLWTFETGSTARVNDEIKATWVVEASGKLVVPLDGDGYAVPLPSHGPTQTVVHPMRQLIKEAEEKWNGMVNRQSKTLEQAVAEYKRRYGRPPPLGFDVWYQFASNRSVVLIDEFDTINHEIFPFLALAPEVVKKRVEALSKDASLYHLQIQNGVLLGDFDKHNLLALFQDFVGYLPDMKLTINPHDVGPHILGEDMIKEAEWVVAQNRYITHDYLQHFEDRKRNSRNSVTKACLVSSPAVRVENGELELPQNRTDRFEFIYDHHASKNFCQNPSLLLNHGFFINANARDSNVSPFFVRSKVLQGGGMLIPPTYSWAKRDGTHVIPWADRTQDKLFWRGSTTGSHHNSRTWRQSHRNRLHLLATSQDDADVIPVLVEDQRGRLRRVSFSRRELNREYMDVGLAGGRVTQCEVKDGACEEMEKEIKFLPWVETTPRDPYWGNIYWGQNHKYTLDVDGNGWSGRFQGLLAGGSVVFKASIFPEWNSLWLVPYYHYIPVQHDYSDLYSAMVFLAGTPHGFTPGQDELAQRISQNAVDFVARHWRWEDMQAYMFRLLLEYARLMSPDRDAMSYRDDERGRDLRV